MTDAMTKFGISLDYAILAALAERSPMQTYVVKNTIDRPGTRFREGGLKTSHVLTACRRLQSLGETKEVQSRYLVMKTWQITDSGRRSLNLYQCKPADAA